MMGNGNGMMGGGMGLWMVFTAVFWIMFAVGVVLLATWAVRRFWTGSEKGSEDSALEILKKRYTRGEISREEYEEKKRDIS